MGEKALILKLPYFPLLFNTIFIRFLLFYFFYFLVNLEISDLFKFKLIFFTIVLFRFHKFPEITASLNPIHFPFPRNVSRYLSKEHKLASLPNQYAKS